MANYCALSDVRAWMPAGGAIDDQVNPPTAAMVSAYIAQGTNLLNVAIKRSGGTLPVTDPDVLGMFQLLLSRWVSYQIQAVRAAVRKESVPSLYLDWLKEFQNMVEKIAEGGLAAVVSGGANRSSSYTMNTDVGNVDDPLGPRLRKAEVPA